MSPQTERLAKHTARVVMLVSAIGNVGSVLFFALGFGFVTPQKTLAELRKNDSVTRALVADLTETVTTNNTDRISDRDADNRKIHVLLVIECLTVKPSILARGRVNVDCESVLAEDAIK